MSTRQEAAARLGEAFHDLREAHRMNMEVEVLEAMHTDVDRALIDLEAAIVDEKVYELNRA